MASGEGLTLLLALKRGSAQAPAQVFRVHICDKLSEQFTLLSALSPQAPALRLKVPVPVFARGAVVASGEWLISLLALGSAQAPAALILKVHKYGVCLTSLLALSPQAPALSPSAGIRESHSGGIWGVAHILAGTCHESNARGDTLVLSHTHTTGRCCFPRARACLERDSQLLKRSYSYSRRQSQTTAGDIGGGADSTEGAFTTGPSTETDSLRAGIHGWRSGGASTIWATAARLRLCHKKQCMPATIVLSHTHTYHWWSRRPPL